MIRRGSRKFIDNTLTTLTNETLNVAAIFDGVSGEGKSRRRRIGSDGVWDQDTQGSRIGETSQYFPFKFANGIYQSMGVSHRISLTIVKFQLQISNKIKSQSLLFHVALEGQ
ncbi:hypothetical protein GCK32_017222 [Trichostrongylus colubriformis]|uniref:Uncharacterized protein n=1 Tax=Trichostrongylus colubriformis TaxID=6319 RepID=A0AAN8EQP4_TRICO